MPRPEQILQTQIVNALRLSAPDVLAFHVPNGGYRTPREAAVFKAMGVVPGIPDLICLWPIGRVGFLELKAHKGALTDLQRAMIDRLSGMGFPVAVVRSLDDALAELARWGAPVNGRVTA